MRALAVVMLLVAACGDDSPGVDLGTDLTPASDQSLIRVGCAGLRTCLDACLVGKTFMDCTLSCGAIAKPGANDRFVAALACDQTHCAGDADAMNGKCRLDGASFVNLDDSTPQASDPSDGTNPQKACYWCLHDATAALFGVGCQTMSSPDCNPAECQHFADACLDDTP